jgi:hypothetical protein
MGLIQIKHAQIKFHLFGFWTVHNHCGKCRNIVQNTEKSAKRFIQL